MVQGGMNVVKCLVFAFNFVFVVCGIALIVVGVQVKQSGIPYTAFLGTSFVTAPAIIIALGVIIFFIAFLGCCGALKQNYCMIMTFGAFLFLIFIIELVAVGLAYAYKGKFDDLVKENMKTSLNNTVPGKPSVWNDIERSTKCCGVEGPEDYKYLKNWEEEVKKDRVSDYCCEAGPDGCSFAKAFPQGCYPKLKEEVKGKIGVVAGAGIGIAVIEILGIIFAWCLGSAIKKEYEGV